MDITQNLINKTIENKNTELLPTFAIIKDKQKSLIDKSIHTVYLVVTKPDKKHCLEIEKNDALELIELFRMKPFGECKNGAVYDTEDMQYRKKYKGHPVNI